MGNLVGRSLGHFHIEAKLGEGGMGVVYRAIDAKLRRDVALKVLPQTIELDGARRQRFLREARSAAAVLHANIAAVFEVGEADGHTFIAMELVDGETLRARIERGLSIPESLRIAKGVARGLGRAHQRGIVHRDLKPENVMMTRDDDVKILDFGLAKLREDESVGASPFARTASAETLSQAGRLVGTPAYMAPEQTLGEPVDARADVFSFGVVLFEMLTGRRPFQGSTAMAVMLAAMRDTPMRASALNPDVSPEIEALVARCLDKDPAKRFSDGRELYLALDELTSRSGNRSSDPAASPSGSWTPRPSSSRAGRQHLLRRRIVFVLVGLPVLALGARQLLRAGEGTLAPSASATSATPRAIGLLDHPTPPSANPEAVAAYRRALTDLRDALRPPQTSLERAVALDPELAAAHLRLAMIKLPPASTDEYREALRFRDGLDARDKELLRAEEPAATAVPADLAETERRYARLHEAAPYDVEVLMRLAAVQHRRDPASARATYRQLLALAPDMAGAELAAGDNASEVDALDEAGRHYERCLALSPMAARCLHRSARQRAPSGHCDEYARDVTRVLVLEPEDWFFRIEGLSAALTTRAPEDDVAAAVRGVLRVNTLAQYRFEKDQLEGEVALWRGALATALGAFQRAERVAQEDKPSTVLPVTAPERLLVAEETGDGEAIRTITRAYAGARAFTTPEYDADDVVLAAMRRHHVLPDEEVFRLRDRWRRDASGSAALTWLHYDAACVVTEAEARNALASGNDARLAHDRLDVNAELGHLLRVAGRQEDAAARLDLVAYSCSLFRNDDSFVHWVVPAAFELGAAREALGDTTRACAAYRRVVDLWGTATPGSKTADAARARLRALGCAEPARSSP